MTLTILRSCSCRARDQHDLLLGSTIERASNMKPDQASKVALPRSPGTYVLILQASARKHFRIGKLGMIEIHPGYYLYVGSARGPGGLAARVSRHRGRIRSRHWHIDYLLCHTEFREVWFMRSSAVLEHQWAAVLEVEESYEIPQTGFGSSDCNCSSHLFSTSRPPRLSTFRESVQAWSGGSPERL
ncbi:MAG TPA: DUF123 domain-containing protein [Candidatus Latescibacteria bacterium]|jgi:Uri superfamily endonuclease|nr:hypothetical protein [Acidobacteriota bacterium]HCV26274.1 DUF123 domain-containing protein [Candidatus Latescibacterota bacterium]